MIVDFQKLRDVKTPSRSYSDAAGWDFYVPEYALEPTDWESRILKPSQSVLIPSGIRMKIPEGYAMRFDNKSGQAIKGLIVGASIIDSDYQGEIHLHVINVGNEDVIIKRGQKLVQGIFFLVPTIYLLENEKGHQLFPEISDRGKSGFGSTDKS